MSSHARRLLSGLKGARGGSEFVFPGLGSGQRRDARAQVNSLNAEAGLPGDFRPLHGLRHVFASGLVSSGVEFEISPVVDAQRRHGHSPVRSHPR